jgi:hypothetical protein
MSRLRVQSVDIEEELKELEINLNRLRVAYEQYFIGILKREPSDLRAKVQKVLTRLINQPPRNSGQKFRFNQLNAKFQVYRQLWGRIMREIEAGTYRPRQFRAKLQNQPTPGAGSGAKDGPGPLKDAGLEQLHRALAAARKKTGESARDLTPEKLARIVRQQTRVLRKKHGKGKVRFRVVIEDNRAKLKATMKSGDVG